MTSGMQREVTLSGVRSKRGSLDTEGVHPSDRAVTRASTDFGTPSSCTRSPASEAHFRLAAIHAESSRWSAATADKSFATSFAPPLAVKASKHVGHVRRNAESA